MLYQVTAPAQNGPRNPTMKPAARTRVALPGAIEAVETAVFEELEHRVTLRIRPDTGSSRGAGPVTYAWTQGLHGTWRCLAYLDSRFVASVSVNRHGKFRRRRLRPEAIGLPGFLSGFNDPGSFGRRLKKRIEALGISVEAFARESNNDERWLRRILAGEIDVRLTTIAMLEQDLAEVRRQRQSFEGLSG